MRDEYGTREQYPFLIVEGLAGKAEVFAITRLIGAL
jgi:hypothetical protein